MIRKSTGHRFRPGTVSIREIKKLQKGSNCLILAKFPFEKLIRSILYNISGKNIKISKNTKKCKKVAKKCKKIQNKVINNC